MTARRPALVAVTRIRNDGDIVEAFLRHHAGMVDRHILLDDGSTDATPGILAALKAEGMALTVFRDECPWFDESSRNTFLLRSAATLGADWVLFLDADEFVDEAGLGAPLREVLGEVPDAMPGVTGQLVTYNPTAADDPDELVPPLRLRHRARQPSGVPKLFARGRAAAAGASVLPGNHGLSLGGAPAPVPPHPLLFLAHYPMRSGWQMLAKAAIGRLKVLAAGPEEEARGSSGHYTELFQHLVHRPEWVTDPLFLAGREAPDDVAGGLMEQPLRYLGGGLRYTAATDPRLAALRSVMAYAEALARSHGALHRQAPARARPVQLVL